MAEFRWSGSGSGSIQSSFAILRNTCVHWLPLTPKAALQKSQEPWLQPVNLRIFNNKLSDLCEISEFRSPVCAPSPPPSQGTGLEFSSSSETWSWATLHALAPHFPVPEHTCEDKTSLIQRWDEWQQCFWVSVGRKEGTPGPRAQLDSQTQRLAQCCCCRTRGTDKNTRESVYRKMCSDL